MPGTRRLLLPYGSHRRTTRRPGPPPSSKHRFSPSLHPYPNETGVRRRARGSRLSRIPARGEALSSRGSRDSTTVPTASQKQLAACKAYALPPRIFEPPARRATNGRNDSPRAKNLHEVQTGVPSGAIHSHSRKRIGGRGSGSRRGACAACRTAIAG